MAEIRKFQQSTYNNRPLPRMRTVHEAAEEMKKLDANTAVTEYHIRRLVLDGVLPKVKAGKKYLINLDGKPGKLSPSTVRRYYTMISSLMKSAYRLGLIGTNPAERDRITLPKLEEEQTENFTETELNNMLKALEGEPLMFRVLIHLALNTGCRRGELMGLKWSDIDFKTGILTVSRSNYKLTGDSEIRSKSTKTGRSRTLVLPPYCLAMLRKYRAEQSEYRLSLGDAWHGDEWIFIQADGRAMFPTTPTLWFSKFQKRNDLPHRKFHSLRHTSATLLLSNGTNITRTFLPASVTLSSRRRTATSTPSNKPNAKPRIRWS